MKTIRTIPSVMFSQHPDHANRPFWHHQAFIETHSELKESYLMYKDLGAQEIMWDWEGKLVDEAVIEKLLGKYVEFFQKNPLGRDIFLTFRVPNPRVESGYRLGRAIMVILSAQDLALTSNLKHPPLFEVILPMVETATELVQINKSFQLIAEAVSDSFSTDEKRHKLVELIPLFETVPTILKSGDIIRQYTRLAKEKLNIDIEYLRPFCARSDPALNSGIVPTTLAIKWALSEYAKFTTDTGIPTYPIIAPGSPHFRGGLTPSTVDEFIDEFPGIRTIVIQSAFRYDFDIEEVKVGINKITKRLPTTKTQILDEQTYSDITSIIPWFEDPYKKTIKELAASIIKISTHVPPRRERMQHVGIFGYSRSVGDDNLPRAIGFTASCYSLGIPPELIGTGRGIQIARRNKKLEVVESLYKNLKPALETSGRYLRHESLSELGLKDVAEDVKIIEDYLGHKLGPQTAHEHEHADIVAQIVSSLGRTDDLKPQVEAAALLRRNIG